MKDHVGEAGSLLGTITEDNVAERLARILDDIPNAANRARVEAYLQYRAGLGKKASTRGGEARILADFCRSLGAKNLDTPGEVTRRDVEAFMAQRSKPRTWRSRSSTGDKVTEGTARLSDATRKLRADILRQFYRWLRESDAFPPEVAWLKQVPKAKHRIATERLPTKDDLLRLLEAQPDAQDRALLAVLFESGLRRGELVSLNVGSVTFDPETSSALLTLPHDAADLKTGPRSVLLLESWRYVVEWLNHHPNRHDPAAPLFLSRSRRNPGERLSGAAVYALVQRAEQRAGLQKGLTVKAFRPAAYGELVKNYSLPEPSLRQHFGWSARSAMPAWYNHLLPADYQQILLAKAGKLKPGAEPKPVLARVACRLCGDPNLPTDAVCRSCSCPLSPQAVAEHRERLRAEVSAEFQRQVDALVGRLPMDVLRRLIEEDLRKLPGWPDPGVAGNLDQVRMTVAANCPMCRVPAPHEHAAGEFFAFVSGPGMPPEVRAWLERQRPAKETA